MARYIQIIALDGTFSTGLLMSLDKAISNGDPDGDFVNFGMVGIAGIVVFCLVMSFGEMTA